MFERFTSAHKVAQIVRQGDIAKLKKIIRSGCRIDKRAPPTYFLPSWMTPLDVAANTGNASIADMLLTAGVPLWGSSIFEAITADNLPVLQVFHKHNASFFNNFLKDKEFSQNPFLNRWLLLFTALDYALSINADACSQFLTEIGAPKKEKFTKCRKGHYAPLIRDIEFMSFGGVNFDGHSTVTEGYYCAKCGSFV